MPPGDMAAPAPYSSASTPTPILTRTHTSYPPPSKYGSPSRRRLQYLFSTTLLLFLAASFSFSILLPTEAVSCVYPTADTSTPAGAPLLLSWEATELDTIIYDSLSADLYCMDNSGLDGGQWRIATNLFVNKSLDTLTGQYAFQLPDCGPVAFDGAIRLVAQSTTGGIGFQEEDTCYFKILRSLFFAPRMPVPPTTTTTITTTTTTEPPKFKPSQSTTTSSIKVVPTTPATTNPPPPATTSRSPSPTEHLRIIPSTSVQGTSATLPSSTSPPALPTTPGSPSSPSSSSPHSDSGMGTWVSHRVPSLSHSSVPTSIPLPTLPEGNKGTLSDSESGVNSKKIKTITATLGSIGTAACLAVVILSLLVVRKRQKIFGRTDPGKNIARSLGGAGVDSVLMKEKRRIRLRRQPKEGYFYQIENDDGDEKDSAVEYQDVEMQRDGSGMRSIERLDVDTTMATMSHMATSSVYRASGSRNSTTIEIDRITQSARTSFHTPIAIPPLVYLEPPPLSTPRHRYSIPPTDSESQTYTMPSMCSSVEASSVIRQYWAASMAARAERHEDGYLISTQGLENEAGSSYEEGSIFGDGSRSSESRMADIVSMRTTGTGISSGYHYRRSTLNSFGGLSSDPSNTATMSLSSIPDSLMISEDEFLERLQMQNQLEQEYYSRYYDHDPGYYDTDYHYGSMASRRTSSLQSLTSSNDPFKTFDSNGEIPADDHVNNPFADEHAVSRTSSHASKWTASER